MQNRYLWIDARKVHLLTYWVKLKVIEILKLWKYEGKYIGKNSKIMEIDVILTPRTNLLNGIQEAWKLWQSRKWTYSFRSFRRPLNWICNLWKCPALNSAFNVNIICNILMLDLHSDLTRMKISENMTACLARSLRNLRLLNSSKLGGNTKHLSWLFFSWHEFELKRFASD